MEPAKIAFEIDIQYRIQENLSEGASPHISVLLCQFIPIKTTSKVEIHTVLESNSHTGIFP